MKTKITSVEVIRNPIPKKKTNQKICQEKSNANLSNRVGESLSNISSRLEVSIELLYLMM
jgi:hypothetical protein